jgi:modulator of FtsH protease
MSELDARASGEALQGHTLETAAAAKTDTGALLGQVMFLVAVALGVLALGSYIGRDLAQGTATILFFVGFGMLIVANFVDRLRVGTFAVAWLYTVALLFGLGLGPALNQLITVQPEVVSTAAAGTALATVGAGALGFFLSKDLAPWMKPLSLAMLGIVAVSFILLIIGTSAPPFISVIVIALSTGLIVVDFNYLRKHGTDADAVWLATGIFVSIINIFLALLNLLSE